MTVYVIFVHLHSPCLCMTTNLALQFELFHLLEHSKKQGLQCSQILEFNFCLGHNRCLELIQDTFLFKLLYFLVSSSFDIGNGTIVYYY
jgi:hypothetical protein